MSLKSNLKYLLDTRKITKPDYLKLVGQIDGHDRNLINSTVCELKTRLSFDIKDSNLSPKDRETVLAIVKAATDKMRQKGVD